MATYIIIAIIIAIILLTSMIGAQSFIPQIRGRYGLMFVVSVVGGLAWFLLIPIWILKIVFK